MNKFNLREIIGNCSEIYRLSGKCLLKPNTFNFKTDGIGFWIPIQKKDNSNWHGISINMSKASPLGYTVEYSPMHILCNRYKLTNEGCNVSLSVLKDHFFGEYHNFEALRNQILQKDAEFKSVVLWINRISGENTNVSDL